MSSRPAPSSRRLPPGAGCLLAVLAAPPAFPAPEARKEKPAWDVNEPPGPRAAARIDVREGTWMSLDVRPQGDEIVFDLLGDIYSLPMEGGEAKPLREGMAWEMQPRFSPDGEWIAFTSDAKGGDNLWLMRRDGSQAREISSEDFRLLNSPAWTPDGQYVAGRKHFSSERSLGTGEIWLYHKGGGKGVQLTRKTNDQKDLGEPAFSPDGRTLYYSEDVSPGDTFEYNKDPHGTVYAIRRLDREDGRIDTFLDGAGGSVRPTPSPDGRWLAFVRRTGLRTGLHVHEIDSGAERLLWDGLDRDMQETWAIHGVYPAFAWTPDSRHIVFWAGGRIRRIDIATRSLGEIPFHVTGERRLTPALRFPVEVAPARFHTRMLRWVQVAPDGRSVVYQALGRLWIRPLPEGKPRPLTGEGGTIELWPSFSRDGKEVAYTTWSDRDLGSLRAVPVAGGPSRVLTKVPGHFVEPAWSPDGRSVAYRAVQADSLRSRRYTREPGIYVVSAQGGEAKLVSREGSSPHFGAASDRLYFLATQKDGEDTRRVLKSVGLDRSDERVVARSEMATLYRVSPDGRWLAFQERFNAHITPLPRTGRPLEVGPKAEGLPLARVSRDAGDYLHWSGDSSRLHWSLGPALYTRELSDAFAFLASPPGKGSGASPARELPAPPEKGLDIGFDQASDVPTGSLALTGARLVTMRGDEVIEDGALLVEGNRIVAVGPSQVVKLPREALRVDVSGTTILPGLIDVHYHGPQGRDGIVPRQNWSLQAALAFGVTTVHDPSHHTDTFFAASELQRAGLLLGPRLFSTGTILYGAKAPFKAVIDSLDDARSHLRRLQAVGAFSVKSYNQPRRDQRQQVIAAARELRMMVVPEGGSLYHHNMTQVVDGHTGVEHALPLGAGYADMIQLWSQTRVGYTPTLVVGYGGVFGENYWYQHTDVFDNRRLRAFVPGFVIEPRARRRMMLSEGDWNHVRIATLAHQLAEAGVRVQVGAHGQREGLGAHWETWMLAQGGMTPHQALRAATLDGAAYLGLDRDLGSLEPGKLADLVVIEGNPLADLTSSEKVRYTMHNGRLYDAATLRELGNHPAGRPPFFWEDGAEQQEPGRPAAALEGACLVPH